MPVVASRPSLAHPPRGVERCGSLSSPVSSSPRPRRLAVAATATGRPRPPLRRPRSPGCAVDSLNLVSDGTLTIGADNPAFPPWFGGAEKTEAVEGLRPVQRQGLRVGRRLRGRAAARLPEVQGQVDGRAVHELVPTGRQAVRLLPDPGLGHARAGEGGGLSNSYYFVNQSVVGPQGPADREGQVHRGPAARSSSARRSGRRPTTTSSGSSAPRRARSSTTRTTPPSRRSRTARSTASSSTCRRRST